MTLWAKVKALGLVVELEPVNAGWWAEVQSRGKVIGSGLGASVEMALRYALDSAQDELEKMQGEKMHSSRRRAIDEGHRR